MRNLEHTVRSRTYARGRDPGKSRKCLLKMQENKTVISKLISAKDQSHKEGKNRYCTYSTNTFFYVSYLRNWRGIRTEIPLLLQGQRVRIVRHSDRGIPQFVTVFPVAMPRRRKSLHLRPTVRKNSGVHPRYVLIVFAWYQF